jgi:hypothetical protein
MEGAAGELGQRRPVAVRAVPQSELIGKKLERTCAGRRQVRGKRHGLTGQHSGIIFWPAQVRCWHSGWRAPGAAWAQDQTAAAQIPAGRHREEIFVTAQRREQALSDVSLSVTAVGGDELVNTNTYNIEALQNLVPSMSFGNDFNFAKLFIRGIGLSSSLPGVDPSVACTSTASWCRWRRRSSARCSTSSGSKCCAARRAPCTAATPPAARSI